MIELVKLDFKKCIFTRVRTVYEVIAILKNEI